MVVLPVPGALCRECRLCCHFTEPGVLTPWAARPEEGESLPAPFRPPSPIGLRPGLGRMDLPVLVCDALRPERDRCGVWGEHPADCRLYPLVLVHRDGGFLLALDPDCPFALRETPAFFRDFAERFREEEWARITPEEADRIRTLARGEDRPHYRAILPLPEPERSRLA